MCERGLGLTEREVERFARERPINESLLFILYNKLLERLFIRDRPFENHDS